MSVGIKRENIIILFWKYGGCTVSFLGIHKWEPDIYTKFSLALHLQCITQHFSRPFLSDKLVLQPICFLTVPLTLVAWFASSGTGAA
jgi:hypothetical protein